MFKRCIGHDIRMMMFNKRYIIVLSLLTLVVMMDSILVYNLHSNYQTKMVGLFDIVFLGNINGYFGASFHLLMPLLSVYPISKYVYQEKRSNSYTQIISRSSRMTYHLSKCVTSFMTGFSLIFIALIINLGVSILLLKNGNLYSSETMFKAGSAFEPIFNSNIVLYYFIYVVLRSVTAGLIASTAYLLSSIFRFRNEILLLLAPIILFTLQSVIMTFVSPYHDILQVIQINTRYALLNPISDMIMIQVFGFWSLFYIVMASISYWRLREVL